MRLSSATVNNVPLLQDYGSTYSSGQATHSLSLIPPQQRRSRLRRGNRAMVVGVGCYARQWLGCCRYPYAAGHGKPLCRHGSPASRLSRPASRRRPSQPTVVAPTSVITSPPQTGATLQNGVQTLITGTATDSGGQVWGVEVSTDGGITWKPATWRGHRHRSAREIGAMDGRLRSSGSRDNQEPGSR